MGGVQPAEEAGDLRGELPAHDGAFPQRLRADRRGALAHWGVHARGPRNKPARGFAPGWGEVGGRKKAEPGI